VQSPLSAIRRHLSQRSHEDLAPTFQPDASVATILRPNGEELEILFIQRSQQPGDPWSGHLAFPGGRSESQDTSPRATAERETREEVQLDLGEADFLGPLTPLQGISLPISVGAFVYYQEAPPQTKTSDEVAATFWIPLATLRDPGRQAEYILHREGRTTRFPALRLLEPPAPLLWGITYRFTRQLLGFFDTPA
jgi:8-oxo-dGTP pyrophosphatase MutT (NUDIX family)